MIIRRLIIILIFSIYFVNLNAQKTSFKFSHYSKQDGLNQSSVNYIFQDSENYVWIANFGGINRFNGYNFTSYKTDFEDTNSIPDNSVWCIFERKNKSLWFGTKAGLSRYNRSSNNFNNFYIREASTPVATLSVKALFEDSNKKLYVGTEGEGLYIFDETEEKFHNIEVIPKHAKVSSIIEDKQNRLWVATENLGVFILNKTRNNVISLLKDEKLSSITVWSLLLDKNGGVWIGTDTEGLIYYNNNVFSSFRDNKEIPYNLGNKIKTIVEDDGGNIWIGSATEGLSYYITEENTFYQYKNNPFDSNSLFDNDVSSIFSGNKGELYVGFYTNGFNKLVKTPFYSLKNDVKRSNTLSNNNVYSIYKDNDEMLWFGTFGGGLNRYNYKTKSFKYYKHDEKDKSSISHDWVRIIFEDTNNVLWIGTWGGGLNKFDKKTETFTRYLPNEDGENSINHNIITALFEDKDGELWIGTYGGGINIYREKTDDFKTIAHDKNNPDSISDDHITSFFQGENGLIWICTYGGGLNSYNKTTNKFKRYLPDVKKGHSLNTHKPLHIYKEQDSSFYWITTLGGGVNKFYYEDNRFIHYTEKDGLSNNSTMGMLKDSNNTYWISSNNGISHFNPETETFHNYTTADGLASDDYNLEAYAQTEDGTLFFGGKKGVTYFNPTEVKKNRSFPNVIITKVKVEDSLYNNKSQKTIIPYKSRVSFDYAVINPVNIKNIKYAYQLVGQTKEWRHMDKIRHLEFTNLSPGKYELRIKSTNSNSTWNDNYTSFSFKIETPWYLNNYIRIAIILLLLLGVFSYYRLKLIRAKRYNSELENKVKERTEIIHNKNIALAEAKEKTDDANRKLKDLNELKDRILSIVSHDMRSPLLNLESLLTLFEDDYEPIAIDEMPEYTGLIQKELKKVLELLENLLTWAKYQITSVKATKINVDLYNIVADLYDLFESKQKKKNIVLINEIDETAILKSDKNIITFILRNIIFNAIKFTPENGTIRVEYEVVNNQNKISVIDSGIGMTQEKINSLFSSETISWEKGTSGEQGTGLGLILCKDLSEELGGTIYAKSELGKGTTISLEFPV